MWDLLSKNGIGDCALCPVCNGGSQTFCECARKRFARSVKERHIIRYKLLTNDEDRLKYIQSIYRTLINRCKKLKNK